MPRATAPAPRTHQIVLLLSSLLELAELVFKVVAVLDRNVVVLLRQVVVGIENDVDGDPPP